MSIACEIAGTSKKENEYRLPAEQRQEILVQLENIRGEEQMIAASPAIRRRALLIEKQREAFARRFGDPFGGNLI